LDGVKFIKGSGIKYKHPDYTTYDAYNYEDFYISGNKLTHHHINKYDSATIAAAAPIVAGGIVGYLVGEAPGAIAGGLLGAFLTGKLVKRFLMSRTVFGTGILTHGLQFTLVGW
jgi:hypothetical protein